MQCPSFCFKLGRFASGGRLHKREAPENPHSGLPDVKAIPPLPAVRLIVELGSQISSTTKTSLNAEPLNPTCTFTVGRPSTFGNGMVHSPIYHIRLWLFQFGPHLRGSPFPHFIPGRRAPCQISSPVTCVLLSAFSLSADPKCFPVPQLEPFHQPIVNTICAPVLST